MDKIAVDAMGGDFAPLEIVLGAVQAVREYHIPVVLVGDEERIRDIYRSIMRKIILLSKSTMRPRSLKWGNIPAWLTARRRTLPCQWERDL